MLPLWTPLLAIVRSLACDLIEKGSPGKEEPYDVTDKLEKIA